MQAPADPRPDGGIVLPHFCVRPVVLLLINAYVGASAGSDDSRPAFCVFDMAGAGTPHHIPILSQKAALASSQSGFLGKIEIGRAPWAGAQG